jgi:hypothetical protein
MLTGPAHLSLLTLMKAGVSRLTFGLPTIHELTSSVNTAPLSKSYGREDGSVSFPFVH